MQDVDLYVRGRKKAVTTGRRGARATRRPNPPPRIAPYARAGHHNHNQHDGTLAVARLPSRSPHCAQAEVARLSHEKTGTLSLLLSLLLGLGRGSSLAASGALLPLPGASLLRSRRHLRRLCRHLDSVRVCSGDGRVVGGRRVGKGGARGGAGFAGTGVGSATHGSTT